MGLLSIPPKGRRNLRNLLLIVLAGLLLAGVGTLTGLAPQADRLLATAAQSESPEGGQRALPSIQASTLALRDIPLAYLASYHAAADTCPDLRWQVLAGIGKVESNHGRSKLPGVTEGLNSADCCAGPMQFNLTNGPPSTWEAFGKDSNRDGKVNPYDPADAIPAAAAKLCANGLAPTEENRRWRGVVDADPCPSVRGTPAEDRALRRYNNACWYVHDVLEFAARYTTGRRTPPTQDPYVLALTRNPHLHTTAEHGCDPASDLARRELDLRVGSLLALLAEHFEIRISCVHTGHSKHVKGTDRVSNHYVWRAIDIDQVNGQPVGTRSPAARELLEFLDSLSGVLRPTEIGSPFDVGRRPFFTDGGHQGHFHIGYGYEYNP